MPPEDTKRTLQPSVTRTLLLWLRPITGRFGAQPQGDVGGLHRLPYQPDQVVAQGLQVCLVAQRHGERFDGRSCVVLAEVKAYVYVGMNALSLGNGGSVILSKGASDGDPFAIQITHP
jgi:hypothetical protein